MVKYGIDWDKENATDGGYLDDRYVRAILDAEKIFYLSPKEEQEFRKEFSIPNGVDIKDVYYSANVVGERIRYDKKTGTYYFIAKVIGRRASQTSTIHIVIDSEIFENKFDAIMEVPPKNKATYGEVRIIIPIKKLLSEEKYNIHIECKDSKEYKYRISDKEYFVLEDMLYSSETGNIINMDSEYDRKYDNTKIEIEYGYADAVHGLEFVNIEGIAAYQKEDGTWTSDVVANPEKYLKSDLEWYYSDERMVDYIEAKGLLPQDKIDAIRAANYEDIFSFEYKMKSVIKIIPVLLVVIIITIIVIKKIRKRIF